MFGGGFTIWNSTFFECPGQRTELLLHHTEYDDVDPPAGNCNHGEVTAKGIGVYNRCYISQLHITMEEGIINKTIMCVQLDLQGNRTIIGRQPLVATEIPYPPPTNILIESNNPHQITFVWDEVTVQCSSLQYIITAVNCGVCSNTTADRNITCDTQSHISQRTNNECLFAVQTEICGYLRGKRSEYVTVDIS